MGISWTSAQQKVIDLRNRNILVSAAAGSGKTAVLVERIITRLTRDEHPINIDELLSVTFANAAAAEMKERIRDAIELALETDPENEHLQRQVTLIHNAKITTIHSFCLDVIREHFHTIDLDPTFRIAEDGELSLLKQEVLEKLLEEEYREKTDSFINFVEVMAPGKRDIAMEELILELYASSRSNPCPEEWLEQCAKNYEIQSVDDMEQSIYATAILEEVKHVLVDCKEITKSAIEICNAPYGPLAYGLALQSDLDLFDRIEKTTSLQQIEDIFNQKSIWATLKGVTKKDKESGDVDEELIEKVKAKRDLAKAPINDVKKAYFSKSLEEQVPILGSCREVVEELVRLILKFDQMYMAEKRKKNMLEFNDMEHYALQILTLREDGGFKPSSIAMEYQKKFAEVMIDEYQDSNLIQEIIVTSVSRISQGIYNVFMVGDVKQSIYSFRSSRPELFMEKFHTYTRDDSKEATDNPEIIEKQRIDLDRNFRSRREVLDGTNYIFEKIMRASLGGVTYDKSAALYLGADFKPQQGNEMEVRILRTEESNPELEAIDVAKRIKELVGHHQVLDKKTGDFRDTRFGDIVILTRSTTDWGILTEVFSEMGIPIHTESKEGYFTAWEIALLLDYLRVIDNPKQDIPLAAVLSSAVFGKITDAEMAQIRSSYPRCYFHEAVYRYANQRKSDIEGDIETQSNVQKEVDPGLQEKLKICINQLETYRQQISYTAIHELLWNILEETGYQEIVYARPEGEQRLANLKMLIEKAKTFESTSYKGLFNFIRYVEQLQKYKVEMGEASTSAGKGDVVRTMTIHKSKGLEFPIVFLMGMGKQFNLKDASGKVLQHSDLGIGMDAIDTKLRVKEKSIFKNAIANRIKLDSKGEELRILYVAMTRAKEKLILTGAVKDFEGKMQDFEETLRPNNELSYIKLTQARSYFDWILPSIYYHEAMNEVKSQQGIEAAQEDIIDSSTISMKVVTYAAEDCVRDVIEDVIEEVVDSISFGQPKEMGIYDKEYSDILADQLNYKYPYEPEKDFKLKMTVSEIKKREQLGIEAGEELVLHKNYGGVKRVPDFMKSPEELVEQKTGAFRGTSYHRVLEIWDFAREYNIVQVQEEIGNLVEKGTLQKDMAQCIEPNDVLAFLNSNLGKRMKKAAEENHLYKEQPFVMKVPAKDVYHIDTEEITIVQGIVDVYFEEDGRVVLLDYKTDQVKRIEELKEKYQAQLDYYEKAISQLTGKPVKEKIIYSFALKQNISI